MVDARETGRRRARQPVRQHIHSIPRAFQRDDIMTTRAIVCVFLCVSVCCVCCVRVCLCKSMCVVRAHRSRRTLNQRSATTTTATTTEKANEKKTAAAAAKTTAAATTHPPPTCHWCATCSRGSISMPTTPTPVPRRQPPVVLMVAVVVLVVLAVLVVLVVLLQVLLQASRRCRQWSPAAASTPRTRACLPTARPAAATGGRSVS